MSETVEVVIKIPKNTFDAVGMLQEFVDDGYIINGHHMKGSTFGIMIKAIANGTVLPKGHGRLIDADAFEHRCMFDSNVEDMQDVIYALLDYPSVIEADREVENEGSGV